MRKLDRKTLKHGSAERELKRICGVLTETSEFNTTLLKTIPFVMDIVDEKGNILFANDKLIAAIGRNPVGEKCWFVNRDDRQQCADCPLKKGIKPGETASVEATGCLEGRSYQIIHTGMRYEGRPAILEIFSDITERRQAMQQKEDFMNMVSHELRTPLAAIKESISLVSESRLGPLGEKQKEMIDIAKRNVDRLARLINEVLELQKIDAGSMVLKMEANDINGAIGEVYKTMAPVAEKKALKLTLKLDDSLPLVRFDRDKIIQVLTNLVNNAIKFTEKGTITITSGRGDNFIRVSVKDTGPGIRSEDMSKLFRRFSQLKRSSGGTGLGLAICKEIIDLHRGKMGAESEFGKGTTFHFILPLEERRA